MNGDLNSDLPEFVTLTSYVCTHTCNYLACEQSHCWQLRWPQSKGDLDLLKLAPRAMLPAPSLLIYLHVTQMAMG